MSSTPSPLSTVMPPPDGEGGASPVSAGGADGSPTFSPLYQQIKTLILQSLQVGEWESDGMTPSETELTTCYKVSQRTVCKTIDELAAEDLAARRQGEGASVTAHYEEGAQFRLLRLMSEQGEQHYPSSCVLEYKRVYAPAEITRLLEPKVGDSVVQVCRVLFSSGEPTVLKEIWLPGTSLEGLTAEKLAEWKGPIYTFFEAELGVRMLCATECIRAVATDLTAVELPSVTTESSLSSVGRVLHASGDKPMEIHRGLYVMTRHHYQNELN